MKKILLLCLFLGFNFSLLSQIIVIEGSLSSCNIQEYQISNYSWWNYYSWYPIGGTVISSTPSSAIIQWNNNPSSSLKVVSTNWFTNQQNYIIKYLKECCDEEINSDYVIYDGQDAGDLITMNNGNNLSSKTVVINGDFTLDESITSFNTRFLLSPSANIFVENSSNFNATSTSFLACSDKMWGSVTISNGSLEMDKCYINDGYEAIKTNGNTMPPLLKVKNSFFLNNFVNIIAHNDISTQSYIKSNTFEAFGVLKYPFSSTTSSLFGINTSNVSDLTIGGVGEGNRFKNMDMGVVSFNSNINVVDNFYTDCNSAIEHYTFQNSDNINFVANENTIINSEKGISVEGSSSKIFNNRLRNVVNHIDLKYITNKNIEVFGNDLHNDQFTNHTMGISCQLINHNDIKIYSNTIDRIGYGIYFLEINNLIPNISLFDGNCITNSRHSIQISGMEGAKVLANKIKSSLHCGITAVNCKKSLFYNNDVDGYKIPYSEFGIRINYSPQSYVSSNFLNDFESLGLFEGYTPLRLVNNVFRKGDIGVHLRSNGHISPQGGFGSPFDNRWHFPFEYWPPVSIELHVDVNSGTDGSNSPFYCRAGYPTYPVTSSPISDPSSMPVINTYVNFPLSNVTPPYTCLYSKFTPTETEPLMDLPNSLIDEEALSLDPYDSPSNYIRLQQLLAEFTANPQLATSNNPYSSFIQNMQNNTSMYTIQQMYIAASDGNYSTAEQYASQIGDGNAIESTARQVYSILYHHLQDSFPFRNLTENEIDQIINLSNLCPQTHGYAVRVARSMAYVIGEPLQCLHECEKINTPPIVSARLANTQSTKLYPNPARNEVFITSSIEGTVQITNLMGQVQMNAQQVEQNIEQRIDLSDIPKGVYIINIYNTTQELIESQKLIVQ